jgi:hypothetical protein
MNTNLAYILVALSHPSSVALFNVHFGFHYRFPCLSAKLRHIGFYVPPMSSRQQGYVVYIAAICRLLFSLFDTK